MDKKNKNLSEMNSNEKKDFMVGCLTVIILFTVIVTSIMWGYKHFQNVKQQKAVVLEVQQEKEEKEKQEQEQEEVKKAESKLPLIDFTGKVSPSVLSKGHDGTIDVKVTNKGEKNIEGIKLLFSNTDLVTKGLIIKNVVNGNVSATSNRSFEWPNITIKPNEAAELKIELQANEPGKYDNIITIQPIGSGEMYKTSDGNAELHYKFTIIG